MQKIRSARELRINYETLKMYEALYQAKPTDPVADVIKEIKREVRRYRDRPEQNVIVKDYGIDGAVLLQELPEWVSDENTAKEMFMELYFMPRPNGPYDCTGLLFTGWYKIFQRRGRWMVYHRICVDV